MPTEKPEIADNSPDPLHWGNLSAWCQLIRLPLVFTLIADNVAAAFLGAGGLLPVSAWLPTLIASLCAYWAGMILNDVADLEQDRLERPNRPLAAGKISPAIAGHVGNVLLILAPLIVLLAVTLHQGQRTWAAAAIASAVLLSLAIKLYDSPVKRTPIGPLLMGACRGLHLLMVGLVMYSLQSEPATPWPLLMFALCIGVYIVGITTYARHEAATSSRATLAFGLALELIGLGLLAAVPQWSEQEIGWPLDPDRQFPMLIGLISLTVLHQGVKGLTRPQPRFVQGAVKHALLTLILLDASVVAMWGGKWAGAATVLLVLPAIVSSYRFRTT